MWPFSAPKIAQDDLKRLDRVEERTESLARRMELLLEDIDEYFKKVNKARQRVVKEDRDAGRGADASHSLDGLTREQQKAALRARMRVGGGSA